MNIVIPMAGEGSRFQQAGFTHPKPLIEVLPGISMIELVYQNLSFHKANVDKFIFIVRQKHIDKYAIEDMINVMTNEAYEIVVVNELTRGAAETVMLAAGHFDNDDPLVIANSDQYINPEDVCNFYYYCRNTNAAGSIMTFSSCHPRWSFIEPKSDGSVARVMEKTPISRLATTGIYYWSSGSMFCEYAHDMINNPDHLVNNEYYVAPVYNLAIEDDQRITYRNIPLTSFSSLGTPEDLRLFQMKELIRESLSEHSQ